MIPDDITNLPSMHGFVKFPDGFPAARILLEWKNYPIVAPGFLKRPVMQPVRSKRGEEISTRRAGEAGGRDGAVQIVDEWSSQPILRRKWRRGSCSRRARTRPPKPIVRARVAMTGRCPRRRTAAGGGKEDGARGRTPSRRPASGRRRPWRGPSPQAPQVEDQTLIELRQGFAAGRDQDDLDMGI